MSRTFAVLAFLLAPIAASAQTENDRLAAPPTPPAAELLPVDPSPQPASNDDPLGRIERRLDQIESRLESPKSDPVVVDPAPVAQPAATADENWRFRNYNGVWWYWLPSNRWVYWSNGAWVDFVPTTQPSTVFYGSTAPAYSYVPSYSSYGYVPSYGSYSYPRSYSSYGGYYPSYGGYGGYYGGGYYGGLGAVGLGLSIGHAFSHDHHDHGHYHGGYGGFHGGHHSGHIGGHSHSHGGHHHH